MKESLKSLLGDNSSFTSMSPVELDYFKQILQEEIRKRQEDEKPVQVRDIVDIETWLRSPYYLPDCDKIYPYWREVLIDIFREDRTSSDNINQVILAGSIGTGKSTVANIILMRKMYELSCYKNIPALFHLMSSSSIMFIYFSINMTQAERTGFGFFRSTIDACPYFKDNFKRRPRLDSLLVFPENIKFAYGSSASTSIGTNTIASLIDEANFIGGYGGGYGNTERASELYTSMLNRTASRFIMDGGVNHSLNILVSSSTDTGSITEQVISKSRDDPHTYIAAPAQWEVKPDKFSKNFFYVCKGTEYLEPHVVYSTDDVNNLRLSEGLPKEKYVDNLTDFEDIKKEVEKLPPHMQYKYIKVPEDLRRGFETNIIKSLQDLAGVSTGSTGKLFTSASVFNSCIDERFQHPFITNEFIISTGDLVEIKDYLRADFRLKHPERKRYIHIDQSTTTDSTGIASVYIDDVIVDEETGLRKPIIGTDFMLRINPPKPPKKIAIYKIRNFIVYLSKVIGMEIGKVTYDIFNSEESRQILEEMGYNVGYQSVDRSDKAYLDLVEIMYEGRIKFYEYPILRHELFNLIHFRDKRKVDHPKTVTVSSYSGKGSTEGSKDVSDALCLSADTKLFLLSGRELTIEELYNTDNSDEWVLSCDVDNKRIIPVKIEEVIQKDHIPNTLVEIALDNGETVKVTEDHLILMRDGTYKEAGNLKLGDSLMPFTTGISKTWKNYYRTIKSPFGGRPENIYRIVAHSVLQDKWDLALSRVDDDNDFVVTHHINHDKLNDLPSNLEPMTNLEHRKIHADIFIKYNKSEKHAEDNRRAINEGRNKGFRRLWKDEDFARKVKEAGRRTITEYNKSEKHAEDIRNARKRGSYKESDKRFVEMAKNPETHKKAKKTKMKTGVFDRYAETLGKLNRDGVMKHKQVLGKVKNVYRLLKKHTNVFENNLVSFIDISIACDELVNLGFIKKGYQVSYDPELWKEIGVDIYPISYNSNSEFHELKKKVIEASNLMKLIKENLDGDWETDITINRLEEAFKKLKKIGKVGKYKSFKKFTYDIFILAHIDMYNHKVVGIRVVPNHEKVYDLRLNSIHNFGIASGVYVHNCGAVENLLLDTIASGEGRGNSLDDFFEANKFNTSWEPDAMNVEEMMDRILDETIEDMEMFGYSENGTPLTDFGIGVY